MSERQNTVIKGLAACEERGRQAALSGAARTENPYARVGGNAVRWRRAWDDGWLAGEAERHGAAA